MSFNPANTRWAVTSIDNDCVLGPRHALGVLSRGDDRPQLLDRRLRPDPRRRFIATENGKLSVLGKKL